MIGTSNSLPLNDPVVSLPAAAENAGATSADSAAPLRALIALATSGLPMQELLQRVPECLAAIVDCRFCGTAVSLNLQDEIVLKMAARADSGAWNAWEDVSSEGDNGGAVADHVHTQRQPLVINDWKHAPFRDIYLERKGITSAIVVPLQSGGVNFGTLGVYHHTRRSFGPAEMQPVETAANLLGKALQHHRLDQQFAAAASLQKAEWEVGHAALAMLDRNLRIRQINRAFAAISGYALADVQDRPFAEIAAQPGSESSIASTLQQLAPGDPPRSLECGLLNKAGVKRHLAWSFMAVQLSGQELQFLASGMDVSDRQEALERAQRAEAKADTNLKSLLTLKTAIDTGDMMQIRQALIDAARTAEAASGGDESLLAAALLNANRRSFERGQFRSTQRIAPFTSGQIPHPSAFFEVQCHELSAGGFSFFLPQRPKDKKYLVRLGAAEHTILMSVEVRSCRLAEEHGVPQYLVGCKFVERIQR